jgi:hypothetical protein
MTPTPTSKKNLVFNSPNALGTTSLLVRAMRSAAVNRRPPSNFDALCVLPTDSADTMDMRADYHLEPSCRTNQMDSALDRSGESTAPDRTSQASSTAEDTVFLALIEKAREVRLALVKQRHASFPTILSFVMSYARCNPLESLVSAMTSTL